MSENSDERSHGQRRLDRAASLDVAVHVSTHTPISVRVVPAENRVYLAIGDRPGQVAVFLHALDLDRLHAVIHDAFAQLDRPHTFAPEHEASEAYASGWDAALSWVQTGTGDPVTATAPGGAS